MLAVVSHELRNPLAAIRYAARVLSYDGIGVAIRKQTLAAMERQIGQIMRLIDDLAENARFEAGLLTLNLERLDATTVVRRALETVEFDITQRKHRIVTRLPPGCLWIQGDAGRLEQVIVNLLANAARYTNPGGTIEVTVCAARGVARIAVRDSGIGIPREQLGSIFEMFQQANRADPHSRPGLGVCLAVARMLIERHRGAITAASEGVGQGSEFTVSLPQGVSSRCPCPSSRSEAGISWPSLSRTPGRSRLGAGHRATAREVIAGAWTSMEFVMSSASCRTSSATAAMR
jgi:two-component system CheB/CheR fusion protein